MLYALAIVLLLMLVPVNDSFAADERENLIGEWTGTYTNNLGVNGLHLTVFRDGANYRAIFRFYPEPYSPAGQMSGSYNADVRINQSTGRIEVVGTSWIDRPGNWVFVRLSGSVSSDIFSGSTHDEGAWGGVELGPFTLYRGIQSYNVTAIAETGGSVSGGGMFNFGARAQL